MALAGTIFEPPIRVGVISDTHGYLPEGVADAFDRVERIIHAGDIDHPRVLDQLREIAPVTAVRGNMDSGAWAERLPRFDMIEMGGIRLYVLHIVERLDIDPVPRSSRFGGTIALKARTRQKPAAPIRP